MLDLPDNIIRVETVLYKGYLIKRYKERNLEDSSAFYWIAIYDKTNKQISSEYTETLRTIDDAKEFICKLEGVSFSSGDEEESVEDFVKKCFKEFEMEV